MEKISLTMTRWIGSPMSLIIHTIFFIGAFGSMFFGIGLEEVLLILTTVVSLEAIYLAIFIQIAVNHSVESLQEVEEDVGEIQKDVDEIQEDVDEIQKDVDEIQKDVDEIQEDVDDISEEVEEDDKDKILLDAIKTDLQRLIADMEKLKK